jgi:hypothetical protein
VVCTFNGDSELHTSVKIRKDAKIHTFNGDSKLVVHTEFPSRGMSEWENDNVVRIDIQWGQNLTKSTLQWGLPEGCQNSHFQWGLQASSLVLNSHLRVWASEKTTRVRIDSMSNEAKIHTFNGDSELVASYRIPTSGYERVRKHNVVVKMHAFKVHYILTIHTHHPSEISAILTYSGIR